MGLFFLNDLLTKSAYLIKEYGFAAWLKKILLLVAEVFIKHKEAVLFEKDLSEIIDPIHPRLGVKIRTGTQDDVPRLTQLLPGWSARIFCDRHRLLQGDIFFIAQIDNQMVHQTWISFKNYYVSLLNKKIVLREGEAYAYGAYTAPEFRSKNISIAVKSKLLMYLKAEGYKRCFFLVDLKTRPSTRSYEEVFGINQGTRISYWRILGYRSYCYQPYRGVK